VGCARRRRGRSARHVARCEAPGRSRPTTRTGWA
jgi:hypothetical protein